MVPHRFHSRMLLLMLRFHYEIKKLHQIRKFNERLSELFRNVKAHFQSLKGIVESVWRLHEPREEFQFNFLKQNIKKKKHQKLAFIEVSPLYLHQI